MQPQYSPATVGRFLLRINLNGPISAHRPDLGPCWLWLGSRLPAGYGMMWGKTNEGRRKFYVHRVSWELAHEETLADGIVIDHLCRNTSCANPSHLEAVTPGVNFLRGVHPNAAAALEDQCKRGHAFTPDNTARHPRTVGGKPATRRICKRCAADWQAAFRVRHQKKAASKTD